MCQQLLTMNRDEKWNSSKCNYIITLITLHILNCKLKNFTILLFLLYFQLTIRDFSAVVYCKFLVVRRKKREKETRKRELDSDDKKN